MRHAFLLGLAIGCAACGSGAPAPDGADGAAGAPEDAAANSPPVVEMLEIMPAEPSVADLLSVSLEAHDDDRDRLHVSYEWYVNGQRLPGVEGETLEPGRLRRGDRVHVVARVGDGSEEIEERSEPVSIGNALPRLQAVRITPPQATTSDVLSAEVQAVDPDGDPIEYQHRWLINGQLVEGAASSRLEAGKAVRGDEVSVQIAARDGSGQTEWISSEVLRMGNAAPEITTRPVYELAGSALYRYEVQGRDPDGDRPLRYELLTGPPGMTVEAASGVVSWEVPSDAQGSYEVELGVSDPHGARTLQRYALDVNWQASPASAAPSAVPGATASSGLDAEEAGLDAQGPSDLDDFEDAEAGDDEGSDDDAYGEASGGAAGGAPARRTPRLAPPADDAAEEDPSEGAAEEDEF
jgi:hypothetical protein